MLRATRMTRSDLLAWRFRTIALAMELSRAMVRERTTNWVRHETLRSIHLRKCAMLCGARSELRAFGFERLVGGCVRKRALSVPPLLRRR